MSTSFHNQLLRQTIPTPSVTFINSRLFHPYKEWNITEIKQCLDRIFSYLDQTTPPRVIDRKLEKK